MKTLKILILLSLILSCDGAERPSKPENLIAKEKMSEIIYDVFLLNAAKGINKRILENNGIMPQDYVYKKYNIDSLQFAQSNNYYSYDTKVYEDIMDKVKMKIEFEKALNDSINSREEKIKDSINAASKDSIKLTKDSLKLDSIKPMPKLRPNLKPRVFGEKE